MRSQKVHIFDASRSEDVYKVDKTGDRGEPCGVPVVMLKGSEVYIPKLREAIWPVKKERVQSHILEGNPRLCSVCVAQRGLTLSKNPEMLKRRRVPAFPIRRVA